MAGDQGAGGGVRGGGALLSFPPCGGGPGCAGGALSGSGRPSGTAPLPDPPPQGGTGRQTVVSDKQISIIVAVGRNGAIGNAGGIPWRLSSDLKRFKALTIGKPLILGRKTFDSIGRALPGRTVIVITRDSAWSHPGVTVVRDLEQALAAAGDAEEIMIGGGGEIYSLAMPRAARLYITEVDLAPEASVHFPAIDKAVWRETRREPGVRGAKDDADFVFVEYERI
jgi:dihydrofolate reductase